MRIPKRTETLIINALQGGVVPRTGLGYIAVGREREISALLKDIDTVASGGASFRIVSGSYGSGKTFLLQTIKEHAISKGFVVADADLSPERSLIGSTVRKKGLATYRELMGNISIKSSPTGGALSKILDIWMGSIWAEVAQAATAGTILGSDMEKQVSDRIFSTILNMQELVHGYDFANMLVIYWKASRLNDAEMKSKALRWLRGEYKTKTEAKVDFGVNEIVNDDDWYEYLKLFSAFFALIGYKGLIIMIDELINIYKSVSSITRQNNYEKMLSMYNDTLQGKAHYLGIIMSGTPRSIEDVNRGIYSYEALRSRLSSGRYAVPGMVNILAPVINIQPLSAEELFVLLEKIGEIHSDIYGYEFMLSDNDIALFIKTAFIGRDEVTPRSIIRDYIEILDLIYQNPKATVKSLLSSFMYSMDIEDDTDVIE